MRWFTRIAVGLAVALCVWLALPPDAGAGPKPPEVYSVIEGRDSAGRPVIFVVGFKVNALKTLTVHASDGVRQPYENATSTNLVKSSKLALWQLPPSIVADWGADTFDLVFTYGRKDTELAAFNVRLTFGEAAPDSVNGVSIENASVDTQHLSAGLLQNLEDASTLNGFDSDFLRDAANLTGTLDPSRFSAWDDLLNFENRVGTGAGQLAPGDHTHAVGDGLQQTAGTLSVTFSGTGSTTFASRSDHDHAGTFAPLFAAGSGLDLTAGTLSVLFGGNGGVATAARSDHTHDTNYFAREDLSNPGIVNQSTNPLEWTKLKNVPVSLVDGDDDTTYAAGTGLALSGTTFSISFGGGGTSNTAARSDHDHLGIFADASHNHDTRYVTQTTLADDTGTINASGNPVHWKQLAGVPTSIADGVDADTTYIAGTGLSLASGTFSVNLSGTGTANSAARSDHDHTSVYADASHAHDSRYATKTALGSDTGIINAVGNPLDWSQLKNVPDAFADGTDDSIVYSAGDGLIVSTNQFAVLYGGTGSATNVARSDHLHAGTYQPAFNVGTGLNLSLNTLAVAYGGNGSDTNVARADHNHNTIYPLSGTLANSGGTVNQITNPVDWSQLKSVPTGFVDGTDDDTLYTAGTGLTLTNEQFDVDFAGGGSATTASRSDHDHGGSFVLISPSSTQTGTADLTSNATTITATATGSSGSAGKFEASEPSGGTAIGVETISASYWALKATGATRGVSATATATNGYAGYFVNTASSGTPTGVYATTSAPGGRGVYGFSPSLGINGVASATNGKGIHGNASSNGGVTAGVYGSASSGSGFGVQGVNAASGGVGVRGEARTIGVSGETTSTAIGATESGVYGKAGNNGNGVFGENVLSTGNNTFGTSAYGVRGKSTRGSGVSGEAVSTEGWYGVRGTSESRAGVYGESTATGSSGYGVQGKTASTNASGVYGENTSATGAGAWGVYGKSSSAGAAGLYGEGPAIASGRGVYGIALTGVMGESISGAGFGVRGINTNLGSGSVGVKGECANGTAVYGEVTSTTQAGIGVHGKALTWTGYGVWGENTAPDRAAIGVYGTTSSTQGRGVAGKNNATTGSTAYGVLGVTDSTGAAGVVGFGHGSNAGTGTGVYGDGLVGVLGRTPAATGVGVRGESTHTFGAARGVYGSTVSSVGIAGLFVNSVGGSSSTALQVEHTDTSATSGDLAVFKDQGSNVARIDRSGQGFFNGGTATSGADIAESVAVDRPKAEFEPGDVMVVDRKTARTFAKSGKRNSPLVAGIYATKPGVLLRPGQVDDPTKWAHREVPMAVTGIVPCKVCDENGNVEIGDLLVTASKPGYAMKAPDAPKAGTLVGKALEPLRGESGKVEVLITMR